LYGADAVAQAELYFYQGNMQAAEPYLVQGLERARERNQYDLVHRALFYMMRIAAVQGDFAKAESAREQMVELLEQPHYTSRYVTYEIGMGWYYSFLGLPDMVPEWLSEGFVPYGHPYFIENFGNTVRTRYYMLTKNYSPLLAYLSDDRHDDSVLYGRIELLALRACVYYKLKNRKAAFASLAEAKAQAEPNNILLPFIELGKDMRTLSAAAIKEPGCDIEVEWLETINRRSAAYAKRQAHIASRYRQEYQLGTEVVFSTRELEVLMDLSQGLSRTEIAAVRGLSINTVKTVISNTYNKLEVDSLADLIRVAVQQNLI
jgi:LuxR family maltose regulon positive regulatory protein